MTTTSERIAEWDRNAFPYNYWRTTLAPPDVVANPFTGPEHYVDELAIVRMRLIELAPLDFKREHHKLPDSLHELVPAYFRKTADRSLRRGGLSLRAERHFRATPIQELPYRFWNSFSGQHRRAGGAVRPAAQRVVRSRVSFSRQPQREWIHLVSRDGDRIARFGPSCPDSEGVSQGNAFRVTFELTQQAVAAENEARQPAWFPPLTSSRRDGPADVEHLGE